MAAEHSGRYQWVVCSNDSLLPADTLQIFTPRENGSYYVIITNQKGCVDTSACYTIDNVGLSELAGKKAIVLYPSPARNWLHVELTSSSENYELEIYDAGGKKVLSQKIDPAERAYTRVDISRLDKGIYTIKIGSYLRKFINN